MSEQKREQLEMLIDYKYQVFSGASIEELEIVENSLLCNYIDTLYSNLLYSGLDPNVTYTKLAKHFDMTEDDLIKKIIEGINKLG